MKPDKKQTIQLVVLGLLVVVFIGYMSFSFLSPKPSKPAVQVVAGAKAQQVATAESSEESEARTVAPVVSGVFPDLASVPARRDPFVAQRIPGAEAEDPPSARPPLQAPRPRPVTIARNPFPRVPSLSVPPLNPFRISPVGEQPASTAVVRPEDEDPKFVVTGVLRGEENVAIIRSGDKGRYVVKQGQYIDGRYKVLYVTGDGVVLADKNRRIHVKLGGDKNAS